MGRLIVSQIEVPEQGWTPLGDGRAGKVTIPDNVEIEGRATALSRGAVEIQGGVTVKGESVNVPGVWRVQEGKVTVGQSVAVTNYGRMELSGHLTAAGLAVTRNSLITTFQSTFSETHRAELAVSGTLSPDSSSTISVSAKGYGRGRTSGNTAIGGALGQSAGSYGGRGIVRSGRSNPTYGSASFPNDWGSGGFDSPGGGLLQMLGGSLRIDGVLQADGGSGAAGGGSGGGIYVEGTKLEGTGHVRTGGGLASSDAGGGGGRVAVYVPDLTGFNTARITASGAQGAEEDGTVLISRIPAYLRVLSHQLLGANNGHLVRPLDHVLLRFNRPVDPSSLEPQFSVDGRMGLRSPTGITPVDDRTYRVAFAPLTEDGSYTFVLLPVIRDMQGSPLDQNANGIPGELDDGYRFDLMLDTAPPRATRHSPAGDVTGTFSTVDVWCSEAIEIQTFTPAVVAIVRPGGAVVVATSVEPVGLNRFRVSFAGQTALGEYGFRVGPNIQDLAGNPLDQNRDGEPGQSGDVYQFAVNLAPVDLALMDLTVCTNELWAGDLIHINWKGRNKAGAPLQGNWFDGVYLSQDGRWDINDLRLASVPHTGGLAAGEVYAGSADVYVPRVVPGTYTLLVRADIFNDEKALEQTTDNVVTAQVQLFVTEVVEGQDHSDVFLGAQQARYFKMEAPAGADLLVSLKPAAADGATELFVRYGMPPTRSVFDTKYTLPFRPNQTLRVPGTQSGTY